MKEGGRLQPQGEIKKGRYMEVEKEKGEGGEGHHAGKKV